MYFSDSETQQCVAPVMLATKAEVSLTSLTRALLLPLLHGQEGQ